MEQKSNRPVDWEAFVLRYEAKLYRTALAILGSPQKLLVQRQRGSLSVKIIGILAHVDSPSKSSFSLALALASRERTELGDRPRMDAISSVEYPS